MRNDQYAAMLLQVDSVEQFTFRLFTFLDTLVRLTADTMEHATNADAALSIFTDSFNTWKDIAEKVRRARPNWSMPNDMFIEYFSYVSPYLFLLAEDKGILDNYAAPEVDYIAARFGCSFIDQMALRYLRGIQEG